MSFCTIDRASVSAADMSSRAETGQGLPPDATSADYRRAAMRAVKLTFVDSGLDDDAIAALFGKIAFDDMGRALRVATGGMLFHVLLTN